MTRYIPVAETAKMVRAALKEAFPGRRFSVRSSSYSGGASIRVTWVDGPSQKAVEAVAKRFEGSTFDPMIDLKSNRYADLNGEEVSFGSDYVFCDREASEEAMAAAEAEAAKLIEGFQRDGSYWDGAVYRDKVWTGGNGWSFLRWMVLRDAEAAEAEQAEAA
jgi:hypothetical protein